MIETHNLVKSYGNLHALQGLSMTVNTGDIYGFIGPNGAGKSTTFKILSTLLKPDSGTASIDGVSVTRGDDVRGMIGYMPDQFGVYEDMSVEQYLDFFAAAYLIPKNARQRLIGDILELTDLTDKRTAMVQGLSRGMQQRLGVARVLVHDPKVLILDEPASGLDPRARIELRELLRELAKMGKTILISSHILVELAEVCTRIGVIQRGRLVFEGTRIELDDRLAGHGRILIEVAPEALERTESLLAAAPFTQQVTVEGQQLCLRLSEPCPDLADVTQFLFQHDCPLRRFHAEQPSLEQAFMILTDSQL